MEIVNIKIEQLKWHTEQRKINDLIPFEGNPRKMTKEQAEQLQKSLEKFNLAEIPAIDTDNKIVAGHQRIKILQTLGRGNEIIDVRIPNRKLTDEEFREYNLRSNKNTGSWDWDELANFDEELLTDVGFNDEELDVIMDTVSEPEEDDFDVDKVVEEAGEPICKRGDLWQLGEHRLMCGDATVEEDVKRLMDGKKADLLLTDPPYGINIIKNKNTSLGWKGIAKRNYYNPIINDDTIETAKKMYKIVNDGLIDKFIIFGGNYFTEFLPPSPCWIIWDKKGEMDSNNFADCEIIWTNFNKPSRIITCLWRGMIKEGESDKRLHPTQKPIKLLTKIIEEYTNKNDIIIDFFGGSGSTLIACEQLNRKCYMSEIDPIYCDVIIKRWENYTGKKAVKI